MKKSLIHICFCLTVFTKISYSQTILGNSIISLIEQNKQECPIEDYYKLDSCFNRWFNAFEKLYDLYFIRDTNLINYFSENYSYITYTDPYVSIFGNGDFNYFTHCLFNCKASIYNEYLESLNLEDSTLFSKIKSSITNYKRFWMFNISQQITPEQLVSYFISDTSTSSQEQLLHYFINQRPQNELPFYYSNLINKIRSDKGNYSIFIHILDDCELSECDSLFIIEYQYFKSIRDSTNSWDEIIWRNRFNHEDKIKDSIRNVELMQWHDHYQDSMQQEFIKEQLRPISEEEYRATLDSAGLRDWIVMNDTTLWYTGNMYTGDDGTNFLSWSNDSLLAKIKSFNLDSLYTLYVNKHPSAMFKVPELFHLWKTTQVIGDRLIDGSLVLQAEDSVFFNNMIQYYADVHSDTANLFTEMQYEAKNQLLRLWPLLTPHFYNWINTPGIYYRFLAIELMASCFTEDMVLYLIDKIDHPADTFEQNMKFIYFEILTLLYAIKDPKLEEFNYIIPPRRPTRTFQQTQDWIDRHIEPLRTRHKLPPID